ncbi:hypothetical protein ACORG1_22730 [Mycobacterium sp. TJFP1]|uniref:Uncharacterized protein n=1 Tax=Mycobacterium dioxanotrophicus TaxID=482462 RepID=A0A1Y0BWM2_9MYCO|nr:MULTISPECIES: hypothetical protein [Mycobacteriaceae]ART67295.1 hypothetical protein BTO20_00505 [Mycobacterium dioxanotrophicus]TGD83754.1 hypothetical protein BayCH28_28550 [Mycolicibacterium sp. CH28]
MLLDPHIADLLYGIHRCTHGHGDELPDGFELTPYVNGIALFEGSRGKLRLSASAVLGLLGVAVFAPENHDQRVPNPNYNLSWGGYIFPINAWWGWQEHFRAVISQDASPRVTLEFGDWWDGWVPAK